MKVQNATLDDVFKDLLEGKSISDYYVLIRTDCTDPKRVRSLQTMSIQNINFKDLKRVIEKENHCLIKIVEESE